MEHNRVKYDNPLIRSPLYNPVIILHSSQYTSCKLIPRKMRELALVFLHGTARHDPASFVNPDSKSILSYIVGTYINLLPPRYLL